MKFRSLRTRLLVTYSGVALLTAIVLGIALLSLLNDYFRRRENVYLQMSARSVVSSLIGQLANSQTAPDYNSILLPMAGMTQTRMRLLDKQGNVLADTGSPQQNTLAIVSDGSLMIDRLPPNTGSSNIGVVISTTSTISSDEAGAYPLPIMATYSFTLFGMPAQSNLRSDQVYPVKLQMQAIPALAELELSEGPAYGHEVISSVFWAWLISSLLAVLIAGLASLRVSRQISAPLIALTAASEQLAAGNLAVRSGLERRDEIGRLASTFDYMAIRMAAIVAGLQRFISDAAHEIQTPLTALQTNLELAANEPDPARKDAIVTRAQSVAVRLSDLTSSLLDLARLEAQDHPQPFERIDLVALASRLCETYSTSTEQAGLNLHLDLPDVPLWIMGQPQTLQRAVGNLIENAIKFTPEGGTVTVSVNTDGGQAILKVTDTGIGLPADELERVFDRFHRARNSGGYPGSGLGLAICKTIVETHEGKLNACNPPSGGACFSMELPRIVE